MNDRDTGGSVDSDTMKKAGVVAIIILLALYCAGFILMGAVMGVSPVALIIYGVVALLIILLLIYEGWQRFKEIDEGLEDAVNDY